MGITLSEKKSRSKAPTSKESVLRPDGGTDKDGRVRTVITRRGRRLRAKFPSRKLGRYVHAESLLERDALYHIEYSPSVVNYQEQPVVIHYYDECGKPRRYFADFLVKFADGSEEFIEVKSLRELNKPDVKKSMPPLRCE